MKDHDFLAPGEAGGGAMAPPVEPPSQRLTNDDFRKLMMTPRAGSGAPAAPGATPTGVLGAAAMTPRGGSSDADGGGDGAKRSGGGSSERAERRKKKKSYYAKLKRQEDDKMAELAAKYRDRAKERRDGVEVGAGGEEEDPSAGGGGGGGSRGGASQGPSATSGYRAVAPDVKGSYDAAERRRQMIQESKFLGGDMEHTHLVKGLDFALLQKVRSEIAQREMDDEGEEDEEEEAPEEDEDEQHSAKPKNRAERRAAAASLKTGGEGGEKEASSSAHATLDPVVELQKDCRTAMAKSIVRTLFKSDAPKTNELFFPGRMAYIIELEEEGGEGGGGGGANGDIPTTTIRSKADVEERQGAAGGQQHSTLSTNDIVINKLTQILSYLRAGSRNKKKKKEKLLSAMRGRDEMVQQELISLRDNEKKAKKKKKIKANKPGPNAAAALPIYDDLGDYKPSSSSSRDRDRDRDRGSRDHRDHRDRRDHRDHRDRDRDRDRDRRHRDEHRGDHNRGGEEKRSKRKPYFDVKEEEDEPEEEGGLRSEDKDYIRKLSERDREKVKREKAASKDGISLAAEEDSSYGYAECYPGMLEMNDAIGDSDDEADYTKMDLGNKKGPVGRWDFDTQEEYADYMSSKEALPKAAFQYGVKMNEGRKTRGKVGQKNEKAKLNQEWSKISAIIDKRKGPSGGGGEAKKARAE